jgi:hypothetical protein
MVDAAARSEAKAKGTGLMSSANWIRKTYGKETFDRIAAAVSPEAAENLKLPLATEWYPASHLSEIWSAVGEIAHPGDRDAFVRALGELGRFVASDNLSTVFRVLIALIGTPEQMFRSIDRFWGQYFQGVRVDNDDAELAARKGTSRVHGLGEVQYLAPVACGWLELGFEKVGARRIKVVEEAFSERNEITADPLVFQLDWQ